jgi:hypothetical protein
MAMLCKTCGDPRRAEIEKALLAGESLRHTAARFGASSSGLKRHRDAGHIATALVVARKAEVATGELARGEDLLSFVKGLLDDAQRIAAQAEKDGDLRCALAANRELRDLAVLLADVAVKAGARGGGEDGGPAALSDEELARAMAALVGQVRPEVAS